MKPKAIKLLRENVRGDLYNLWLDIDFLGKTSKAQCMTEEMVKVDFMIILKLCSSKGLKGKYKYDLILEQNLSFVYSINLVAISIPLSAWIMVF